MSETTATPTKKVTVEQPFKPRNMGREPISHFFGPMAIMIGLVLIATAVYFSRSNTNSVRPAVPAVPAVPAPAPAVPAVPAVPAPAPAPAYNSGIHIQGSHNSVTLNNNPQERVVERVIEKPVYVDRYLPQQPKIERVEKTIVGPALIVVKPTEATQHSVLTTDPDWAQKHAEYVQRTNEWKAMFNR